MMAVFVAPLALPPEDDNLMSQRDELKYPAMRGCGHGTRGGKRERTEP
jgi:hypothetical protein